jgi:putative nucleotidyltransferase with HDIG domain
LDRVSIGCHGRRADEVMVRDTLLRATPGGIEVRAGQRAHERLAVASRLSAHLAPLLDESQIARVTVEELHHSFDYYLAVVQRLDADGQLRVIAAAGPLAEAGFLYEVQPVTRGVNGRVARTGKAAFVEDTRDDPDYLRRDTRTDPGSELSLPIYVDGRVWGVMNLEELAVGAFGSDDLLLAETIVAQVGAALHRHRLFVELEGAFATTLSALSSALEMKDAYTADHADEVAALCGRVGEALGLEADSLRSLRYAALLHDIGKIGIRSEILAKPERLTEVEFEEIKQHTVLGARMLERVPFFHDVHPLVRSAHERWDGSGYPDGLAAEAIPLGARIVCACDAFHAMTSDRPYRPAMSYAEARGELERSAGSHFDPRVVAALLPVLDLRP